ncbi:MAG: hypothetical protein H8D38_03310 [DPANN group archaeon]|nr:hypothetical protein [DPANN group archaeon]
MTNIFFILISITVLFFVLLFLKELLSRRLKEKFCVICAAVSLTWITLLILYWMDIFNNQIILALLIGESTVGIFYLVDARVKDKLKMFRLPFLLTLIVIGYSLIVVPEDIVKTVIFLLVLWLIFSIIYLYSNNRKINYFVKKLLECCKRW